LYSTDSADRWNQSKEEIKMFLLPGLAAVLLLCGVMAALCWVAKGIVGGVL